MEIKENRDSANRLNIELCGKCDQINCFAVRLEAKYKTQPIKTLNGLDQQYRDYRIKGKAVVLHSENSMGISIYIEDGSNEELLRSIAQTILKK